MSIKHRLPFLLLLIFSLCFVGWYYGNALVNANDVMFGVGGDGTKNYFTMMYQAKYGDSWWEFEGANYPFGHPMLYTDGHPPIANALLTLREIFPGIENYGVGIMNSMLVLSVFFAFIFSYFLMLEFKISKWIALVFSIGLVMWSPQLVRMNGHFSLAYLDAFPLALLLFMIAVRTGKILYFLLLAVLNLLYFFFHPYLGMISTFLITLMVLFRFVNIKELKSNLQKTTTIILLAVLPIPVFLVVAKVSDNHPGKIEYPSGFLSYNAELDDVFVPTEGPVRRFIDQNSGIFIDQEWEAWSYIGFVNDLIFLALVILCLVAIFSRKNRKTISIVFSNIWLNMALLSSVVLLFLAMAFPFKQFPELMDYLSMIKQFRSTGRFAWAFYFVSWIFTAHLFQLFYNRLKSSNNQMLANFLLVVLFLFNYYESYSRHRDMSQDITRNKNSFKQINLDADYVNFLQSLDKEEYQAILALPLYHWGSDAFDKLDSHTVASHVISFHTGIPVINANLPRLSALESRKIVQLISPNYYPKLIKEDFTDNRDLLIVKSSNNLTWPEGTIISKSEEVYSSKAFQCYRLKTDDLFGIGGKEEVEEFLVLKEALFEKDGFLLNDSSSFVYFNDFENGKGKVAFSGNASLHLKGKEVQDIIAFDPYTFEEQASYNFSLWYYTGEIGEYNADVTINFEGEDTLSHNRYILSYRATRAQTIFGKWALIEGKFTTSHPYYRIHITYDPGLFSKGEAYIDDILIRQEGMDVYGPDDNFLFKNNQRIPL